MTPCCPGCGRTDMAGITHVCPPVETFAYATAETDLITLRMQVEYWRLEAQRLAQELADLRAEQAAK